MHKSPGIGGIALDGLADTLRSTFVDGVTAQECLPSSSFCGGQPAVGTSLVDDPKDGSHPVVDLLRVLGPLATVWAVAAGRRLARLVRSRGSANYASSEAAQTEAASDTEGEATPESSAGNSERRKKRRRGPGKRIESL